MSLFSTALQVAIEDAGITQNELCGRTGVNQGQLSRYLSDKADPSRESLNKLLSAFDTSTRTRLTLAHLRDHLPEITREAVRLEEKDASAVLRKEPAQYGKRVRLPRELREVFTYLEERAAEDKETAEALLAFCRVLRKGAQ